MLKDTLKLLREQKNLTKKQVADAIEVTERAYITYEYGQRDVSTGTLQKLADFYGVTTDYLLGREPAPDDPVETLSRGIQVYIHHKRCSPWRRAAAYRRNDAGRTGTNCKPATCAG